MINELARNLRELCLLQESKPVLVGVSGGPDSLCLLDVLVKCKYQVVVAHFNHSLRPEADAESRRVQQLASSLGAAYITDKADVTAMAERSRQTIEEAAREARYQFLFAQARAFEAQAVAVGHTADDQVETVLMHLLQGAGLSGLRGMRYRWLPNPWDISIPLIRPFLGVWREEILEWINIHGLEPVHDMSNFDLSFSRNRLRLELIPLLGSYNPLARQAIWRLSSIVQDEYQLIEWLIDDTWRRCVQSEGDGYLVFDASQVRQFPPPLQHHLLRRAMATMIADVREVTSEIIRGAVERIWSSAPGKRVGLTGGYYLFLEGDQLWLALAGAKLPTTDWPQVLDDATSTLAIPGKLVLDSGWTLNATEISFDPYLLVEVQQNLDRAQAWLDIEAYQMPFSVRKRKPGDRFSPLGMGGQPVRLSDYMINTKLPRRARGGWPLVYARRSDTHAEEIIWVPGYQQNEGSRVIETSKRVVHLRLTKGE